MPKTFMQFRGDTDVREFLNMKKNLSFWRKYKVGLFYYLKRFLHIFMYVRFSLTAQRKKVEIEMKEEKHQAKQEEEGKKMLQKIGGSPNNKSCANIDSILQELEFNRDNNESANSVAEIKKRSHLRMERMRMSLPETIIEVEQLLNPPSSRDLFPEHLDSDESLKRPHKSYYDINKSYSDTTGEQKKSFSYNSTEILPLPKPPKGNKKNRKINKVFFFFLFFFLF
jgi:hypothetical protein